MCTNMRSVYFSWSLGEHMLVNKSQSVSGFEPEVVQKLQAQYAYTCKCYRPQIKSDKRQSTTAGLD